MTSSLIRKYARVLAEVALEEGKPDQVASELRSFQELLLQYRELSEALVNPALPFSRKRVIVETVAPQIPLSQIVVNFILVLAKSARMKQFELLIEAYEIAVDEQRGVVRGTVKSAAPLDELTRGRLESMLGEWTGRTMRLTYLQDRSLIGGLRVQIGSTVFDGSIKTQLEQIREQLAGKG
jgi:F-type H+-transporting ATPase subunit delta